MAQCSSYTLAGLSAQCKDSIGGVEKIWLAPIESVNASVNDNVLGISDVSAFKTYKLRKNSATFTTNLTINDNAGNYWTTEVMMDFLKMETAKRLEMMALTMGETVAVVKDSNSKYWFVGANTSTALAPLTASAGVGETGQAKSDSNHYQVTLSVDTAELPYEVNAATITSLEAL